jgi:hypothetical protein
MKVSVILCLLLSILGSCDTTNHNVNFEVVQNFKIEIPQVKSMTREKLIGSLKYIEIFKTKTLYYYNETSDTLTLINLDTGQKWKEVYIKCSEDEFGHTKRIDCKVINEDTIAFFSYTDQKLVLTDFEGNLLYSLKLREYLAPNEEVLAYWDKGLVYNNGNIEFMRIYNDIVLNSKEAFAKYFDRKCNYVIDLASNAVYSYLNFPKEMMGNFYGELDYYSIASNQLSLYSFPFSDSIYVYDDKSLSNVVYCGSKYRTEFNEYDLKQLTNFKYKSSFMKKQSMYLKLIHDKDNNFFYRLLKLPAKEINGKFQNDFEVDWSLIILNGKYELLGEILFNSATYTPYLVEATNNGLLISKSTNLANSQFLELDMIRCKF